MKPLVSTIALWLLLIFSVTAQTTSDNSINYAKSEAELALYKVSDQTFEVQLLPIGQDGELTKPSPSDILIDYPRKEVWRERLLDESTELQIGDLAIQIEQSPLSIEIRNGEGELVQELSWRDNDGSMSFRTEAPVFGLGQGGPQFDRRGYEFPWQGGWGAFERPTHGSRVFAPMLIGADGWAMFVHQPIDRDNIFDLRGGQGSLILSKDARKKALRFFVISWNNPTKIFSEYNQITGQTPMPPKWTLGYMQSHRTLEGPDEIREVARKFRTKNLPSDALIYLGTGFTPSGWNGGHGSFEYNPETFPNPEQIIDDLDALNFKTVLHTYGAPDGLHGTSIENVSVADSNHISNYWDQHRPVFQAGADAWWPDGGEGLSAESRLARQRMYYLGPLSSRPNVRPWSFHRTGYSGVHRYGGWIWSGDPDSYWETLETQIAVGLNHTVSLTPFWGSDTGGFLPSIELTGELYTRWFQFSAFCSSFRSHGRAWHLRLPWGWNTAELGPPEVDAFSDAFEHGYPNPSELRNGLVEPIAREYLQLRYRLLPYNYTLFRETHDTGLPPMRAMWLHYLNDPKAVKLDDQYMWGPNLLIAPVYTKGAKNRTLYLPDGQWYDFWTNETAEGGQEITRQVDLATMPIYVRAGTILPMDPVRQYTGQPVDEPTTIRIYPGDNGEFRLYNDDGQSLDYEDDEYSWTLLQWDEEGHTLTIAPDPDSEGQDPGPAELKVKLMSTGAVELIRWDGTKQAISFSRDQE
jgi:alpha-glucosidase/alpha-D-xyloside xylohydrolase